MFEIAENITCKGKLELKVFKKGALFEDFCEENLIVIEGKKLLAEMLSGKIVDHITHVAVGTNGTDPIPGDTDLSGKTLVPISEAQVNGQTAEYSFVIDENTANGTDILEFGLFSSTGRMFARRVRSKAVPKDEDIYISGTWSVRF